MKKMIFLLFAAFLSYTIAFSQKDSTRKAPEFNIKQFWMVILKTGPNDKHITDSTERATLFSGHFANIQRLYGEGILKVAGPFGKNDFTWRGLFIFDCATKEEAEAFVKTDPTVKAGVFIYDIIPWYGEPIGSFKPGKPEQQ